MISLRYAGLAEGELIHAMQKSAFKRLYDKYQDDETSPVLESVECILARMERADSRYALIWYDQTVAGAVRIKRLDEGRYRLASIFVLPAYQGRGIGRRALALAESLYPEARSWELDTIRQEETLCSFYEAAGYERTGGEKKINEAMTLVDYKKLVNKVS